MLRWVVCGLMLGLCLETNHAAEPGLDPAPSQLVVMTWNVEWMFDHDQSDNKSDLSKQQSSPSADYGSGKSLL